MDRRGIALPLAILLCAALGFVVAGAAELSLTAGRISRNFDSYNHAFDAAEAGLDEGVERLAASYEAGAVPPDTATVAAGVLAGYVYSVRAAVRRERPGQDLNGNGAPGEVVRYDRAWGFASAQSSGGPGDVGEPVRQLTSATAGPGAAEELRLEVAFERDPAISAPTARGAWRAIPLHWSALVERP
ncbi:MAG: hypothetical protein H0V09_05655 [Gemmatimonadetes bacterium]|nr:hypothetical protein [Gemmatimonadota bacterium]